MLSRITQSIMDRRLVSDLGGLTGRMSTSQRQISSGRQILAPSDDPLGTKRALGLRGALDGATQYGTNVGDANGWLQSTDDALGQVSDVLNRVKELTVRGASDTSGPEARQSIALEVDQLIDSLKQTMNTTYEGSCIFGGTATTTPPYALNGTPPDDTYHGDAGVVARTIGPGVSLQVNTLGSDVLGSGQSAADGRILATLRDIAEHLRSTSTSDKDLLRTTDLANLDANLDTLSQSRATVGAEMDRLDAARTRLDDVRSTTTKLLSDTEDVDVAQAMIDFTNQRNVYEGALRSGGSIIQPSLLDFLK